jgi:predicted ribosomally synthesized peptide with SipW-like signal peptide
MKKRIVLAAAACALVVSTGIGGTMAYLTDKTDTKVNTFKVGKVEIEVEEPTWDANKKDNSKYAQNLVPNQTVQKDPQVKNTGNNDAIVFMKVTVPVKSGITFAGANGTKERASGNPEELFYLQTKGTDEKTAADGNSFGSDWVELTSLEETDSSDGTKTYVFGYDKKLAAGSDGKDGASTSALFNQVQLKNVVEGQVDESTQNISIEAYAIQADYFRH